MIKLNKYQVVDTETKIKARVHYSYGQLIDGRKCVTIYSKDYDRKLGEIFTDYTNDTDSREDYFDKGRVRLFQDNPLYEKAKALSANLSSCE